MANSNDLMDVVDQNGNQLKITRADYSNQVMTAAKQNWDNIQFFRQVAPQMLNEGFVDEALELAERACELSGGHIPDLYWKAAALAESGEVDSAGKLFEEIQDDAAYPADQARAAMGLARVRARQNRGEDTQKLLEWAAETDVNNPQYLILLYGYFNETNRADDGLAHVKSLVEKNPTRGSGWRALMQIAASRQDLEGARNYADKALELGNEADKQAVLAEISWHYGQAGKPDEIIKLLAPQINDIKHPLALLNLSQAYVDTGRPENALTLLEAMDKAAPAELKPTVQAKLAEVKTKMAESGTQPPDAPAGPTIVE